MSEHNAHIVLLLERLTQEAARTNELLDHLAAQIDHMGGEQARLITALLDALTEDEEAPSAYLDERDALDKRNEY